MEIKKNGKIIVIEGTDSSGKETQTNLLFERLNQEIRENSENIEKENKEKEMKVKKISFPNYESPACAPVKMYLAGEFGEDPIKINPYPISTMYAIDRYASFKQDWEKFYNESGIIVTDRYTTSNMVHQASKIENYDEKLEYLNWLEDLEYEKIRIPRPDVVIFLNMPTEFAIQLMEMRKNKITGEMKKDIHEKNHDYLKKSHDNACEVAKLQNWVEVMCVEGDRIKTIEEIGAEVYNIVKNII